MTYNNGNKFDDEEFAKELQEFQQRLGINRKKTLAQRLGSFLGGLIAFSFLALLASLGILAFIYVWAVILAL